MVHSFAYVSFLLVRADWLCYLLIYCAIDLTCMIQRAAAGNPPLFIQVIVVCSGPVIAYPQHPRSSCPSGRRLLPHVVELLASHAYWSVPWCAGFGRLRTLSSVGQDRRGSAKKYRRLVCSLTTTDGLQAASEEVSIQGRTNGVELGEVSWQAMTLQALSQSRRISTRSSVHAKTL